MAGKYQFSKILSYSYLLIFFYTRVFYCQTLNVNGNVSTAQKSVKYAQVTFTNVNDSLQKFSTLTDSSGNYELNIVITSIGKDNPPTPSKFELAQNYPNPFSSGTAITYTSYEVSEISIRIYDILGQEVKRFNIGEQQAGVHGITWDGTDNFNRRVSSGIYFYQLLSGKEKIVKKMVLDNSIYKNQLPSPGIHKSNGNYYNNLRKASDSSIVFKVEIINTDTTKPQILPSDFPTVTIQNDTVLNFKVVENKNRFSLCYQTIDSVLTLDGRYYHFWDIRLSDITGTEHKKITNWKSDNTYPKWSPDGNYIAFTKEGGYDLYLYDTVNDSLTGLIVSDTMSTTMRLWTPGNKIMYNNKNWYEPSSSMYLINPDGSNNRKIYSFPDFFFSDGYNFLRESDYYNIYHSNIDGTVDELILDLKTLGKNYVYLCDFDPYKKNILILADPTENYNNLLLTYNIDTKIIDTISIADSGWIYAHPLYSNNKKKIVIIEGTVSGSDNKISILENGIKTNILETTGNNEWIDFNPMAFSQDDNYLAFSKNIDQPGTMVWWISYLYVINLSTKELTYIDRGINPQWNLQKPH